MGSLQIFLASHRGAFVSLSLSLLFSLSPFCLVVSLPFVCNQPQMTNPYSHAAVRDWLQSISANDLGSSKRLVVSVSADDNIADAWRTLIANKILGAPVFDEKTKKYIGMFDVSDVVHVLFTPLDEVAKKDGLKEAMNELLAKQNVRDVLSADEPAHTFHHLSDTASLLDVMKKMVAERAHRICLVDKDQKLCNIVTQSTVIEFLAANRSKIQELAKVTPEQVALHNVWADVVMFNQSEKALHAFRKLRAHHVSGAAIVDDDKKLVGNLS